jgi:hypothetical protein
LDSPPLFESSPTIIILGSNRPNCSILIRISGNHKRSIGILSYVDPHGYARIHLKIRETFPQSLAVIPAWQLGS